MTTSVFKAIIAGAVIGAVAFFAPFVFLGFLIVGLIMRLIFFRRFSHQHYTQHTLAFSTKIRTMNEEEFEQFKSGISSSGMHPHTCHYKHSQINNPKN